MGGKPVDIVSDALATGWATDSRAAKPGEIFLAIKGAHFDGHDMVRGAYANGAVAAITERTVAGPHILVPRLTDALAKMALQYRQRFHGPVIGITGSAGKTTTKEFVAAAVSPLGRVLKTEGNRNTEFTSPLLWTELTPEHRVAVVEMGMRGFGHIAHLASFSKPTVGLITNIGVSHLELVGSREGIAKAKSEILAVLPPSGAAVLWHEDDFLSTLEQASPAPVVTFGSEPGSDCQLKSYAPNGWSACRVNGSCRGIEWSAELSAIGRHVAIDAAAAVLAASCVGVAPTDAAACLAGAKLPPLRMEIRQWNGATILLDAYNASPASMIPAIEVLAEGPTAGRRIAVIGEMRELGEATDSGHRQVGEALASVGLDSILLYGAATGPTLEALRTSSATPVEQAYDLDAVEAFLRRELKPGDVALVKGSRSLELEKAVPK